MTAPDWDPNMFLVSLIITVVLNVSVFLIAFTFQTDVLTDLTGAINYILVAVITLFVNGEFGTRQLGLTACICAARVYLGGFLFWRASQRGGDARFDKFRDSFIYFGLFWFGQIVWVYLTSLPIVYVNSRTDNTNAYISDYVVIGFFAVGLLFQAVGDIQKFKFKASGAKGIMKSGVWSVTRHPNYFGEALMWLAIFALSMIQWVVNKDDWYFIVLNALSPVFTLVVLLFGSGIPFAEGAALRRIDDRGYIDEWNEYARTTPPLIPFVGYECLPDVVKLLFCCEFERYKYRPEKRGLADDSEQIV